MEITPQVYPGMFVKIPTDIKLKIIEIFKVPKSGYVHVVDGNIITDGYTEQDLSVLNVSTLKAHLKSKEDDIFKLLNTLIESIKNPAPVKSEVVKPTK